MTAREYHPELPDHPIIWIGAEVATATGYNRHENWYIWTVDSFTRTQVVLRSKTRPETTDRWRVDGLKGYEDGSRFGFRKGGHGRGETSTTLRAADDKTVLKDQLVKLYGGAAFRLETQLSLRDQKSGHTISTDLMRERLGKAHAELHRIVNAFNELADQLEDDRG